jgi:AcrR family transcriptional regulator
MARVIKHPEVRRAELIAAARSLFFERGYDVTSVEEIIALAGVSKGAFYYYFPSKASVLEALAEQMAETTAASALSILNDETLNGFERLQQFLRHDQHLKAKQAPEALALFEALFRPENLALHHHVLIKVGRVMNPVMARILQQGMDDGSFLPGDPLATAEVLLGLTATTHDTVAALMDAGSEEAFNEALAAFEQRWVAQGIMADRILGLPEGTIAFIEPGFAEAFTAGWRRSRAG